MTVLRVRNPGPMTSLQDSGRFGSQRLGISRSGAMDRHALAHANTLVGNPPDCGAMEFTLSGGRFTAEGGSMRLALAGAAMSVVLDGEPVGADRSFTLSDGQSVTVGGASAGVFAYLAAAGGFAVAPVLGSVSLQSRASLGGLDGRVLREGDTLPLHAPDAPSGPDVTLPFAPDPAAPIRVVLGPQADYFDERAIAAFGSATYTVSAEADRMGFRLAGTPIEHLRGFNIVSDGLVAGSIQVPGSGLPIVLMADHQTTGGYPKIATVISADLGVLAQRRSGDPVRFAIIGVEEAQAVARQRAAEIADLPGRLVPVRSGLPSVEELLGLNLAGAAADAFAPT